MKKIWNWLTEDFETCYEQEPLLPRTLKEWLLTLAGGAVGFTFLLLIIYTITAIELLMK